MIGRFAVLASRIRHDLVEIERVVQRVERAIQATGSNATDRDLLFDSAALSLHDFYSGLERVFEQIAAVVDQSVPSAHDWHRELLRQMEVEVPGLRPQVISSDTAAAIDEYRRFRHVVRNVYAFDFDPERIEALATRLKPAFAVAKGDLSAFAAYLENVAQDG